MVYALVNVVLLVKNVICAQVVILAIHVVNVQADIKKNKVENAQVSTIYSNICMYYFDSITAFISVKACGCDKDGSNGIECNPLGQCNCKSNINGLTCNSCNHKYFGFPTCQSCHCDPNGSINLNCNAYGKCSCRTGYTGQKCNSCNHKYFGFPTCRSCHCDPNGSISLNCNANGQCSCKAGYTGQKCNTNVCPGNWVRGANRKSYKGCKTPVTWNEAKNICWGMGGSVATPFDYRENNSIASKMRPISSRYWINPSTRGTVGSPPYSNWNSGSSPGPWWEAGTTYCVWVRISSHNTWFATPCTSRYPVVCERGKFSFKNNYLIFKSV